MFAQLTLNWPNKQVRVRVVLQMVMVRNVLLALMLVLACQVRKVIQVRVEAQI